MVFLTSVVYLFYHPSSTFCAVIKDYEEMQLEILILGLD